MTQENRSVESIKSKSYSLGLRPAAKAKSGPAVGSGSVEFDPADVADRAARIAEAKKEPLFRSANRRTGQLTTNPLSSSDAWAMVRRRAKAAGIETAIGCHTFRATGITVYLTNGGTLEKAQQMAAHESAKTTKLYDRTDDAITLDEVERIAF